MKHPKLCMFIMIFFSISFIILSISNLITDHIYISKDIIFTEFYQTYEPNLIYRSNSNTYLNAINLYQLKKFDKAKKEFIKINKNNALFFIAMCDIEQGNYNNAIINLNKCIKLNNEFNLSTKWYLSLAYIKIGEIKKAKPYLNDLAKLESIYKEKAKFILNISK